MNPYVMAAGIGLSGYGSYKQSQSAQQQYELAVQAWEADQERQRRQAEDQRQQQLLTNVMSGGQYAQGLAGNAQNAYGSYARQVGL